MKTEFLGFGNNDPPCYYCCCEIPFYMEGSATPFEFCANGFFWREEIVIVFRFYPFIEVNIPKGFVPPTLLGVRTLFFYSSL